MEKLNRAAVDTDKVIKAVERQKNKAEMLEVKSGQAIKLIEELCIHLPSFVKRIAMFKS